MAEKMLKGRYSKTSSGKKFGLAGCQMSKMGNGLLQRLNHFTLGAFMFQEETGRFDVV